MLLTHAGTIALLNANDLQGVIEIEPRGVIRILPQPRMLRDDAEKQQCLVVLLHTVPCDFTHDQLPKLRERQGGVVPGSAPRVCGQPRRGPPLGWPRRELPRSDAVRTSETVQRK